MSKTLVFDARRGHGMGIRSASSPAELGILSGRSVRYQPMPNGGSDCCGECSFNRAMQELGSPHGKRGADTQQFWERSYCNLRSVRITTPFWTYCANYTHGPLEAAEAAPKGSILASGVYEGYARIPWHGDIEPFVNVSTTCSVCGRQTKRGIEVESGDSPPLGFCSNRHYVRWWKTQHDDGSISESPYADPDDPDT